MENRLGQVLVISGGTGYNELVNATPSATYVMPISDDGGSSSEIIRVLGGPSIGDIRSRLVRLIPTTSSGGDAPTSNDALHALLSHRLPVYGNPRDIKQEWMEIVEGTHRLWRGIEAERKEAIRGFLVHFEMEVLRRAHRQFDFRGGSIGNFFLAAMQKFFRSIQSAIFMFSAVALMPAGFAPGCRVIPAINTNHTATIAAELQSAETIVGQCEISHPAERSGGGGVARKQQRLAATPIASGVSTPSGSATVFDPFSTIPHPQSSRRVVGNTGDGLEPQSDDDAEGGGGEGEDTRRAGNLVFSKSSSTSVPAPRIRRLFYVNAYGNEVQPAPNPEFVKALHNTQTLIYSCGSLWTSIVPCVCLRGVGKTIAETPSIRQKVLLLNSVYDRETYGLTASDFVRVLTQAMSEDGGAAIDPHRFVTHVVYNRRGEIPCDAAALQSLGIRAHGVDLPAGKTHFDEACIRTALQSIAGGG